MSTPADQRVMANVSSLLENYFASVLKKTDSNYHLEVIIKERGIPVAKIDANSAVIKVVPVGGR